MAQTILTGEKILTDEQLGHLRHFDNLSRLPTNDWSLMSHRTLGQDDFSSYRYQLAYMIYGSALTHRHRLPAAPGLFQPMIQRLMTKLMDPEVWLFWKETSRGHAVYNEHLTDTYVEQWDPVVRDNIMYSGYVQSGALLHDYLFDSDRYAEPGSIKFHHWTPLWGGEAKNFEYDRDSLSDNIYWQMVRNGYLGVACEPNCIFQICNQPAILGFRINDMITGSSRAEEVIANYQAAWKEFGRLDEDGHYNMLITEDTHDVVPANRAAWVDGWTGTVLNMWNRDFVRKNYPAQIADLIITHNDGTISVRPTPQTFLGMDASMDWCDFGWVAAWASEMGDDLTRDGLLAYADKRMNPTYRNGGLYYPRNDDEFDSEGNFIQVDPQVGNVLLGYARLNIADGLWKLFNEPWGHEHFQEPALTVVDADVDVRSAEVVDGVLTARIQRRTEGTTGSGTVTIGRALGCGDWKLQIDGVDVAQIRGAQLELKDGIGSERVRVDDAGDVVIQTVADHEHHLTLTPQI